MAILSGYIAMYGYVSWELCKVTISCILNFLYWRFSKVLCL